jgi:trafficking protein particle complex subunit 8
VITCTIIDSIEFGEHEKKTINMRVLSKFTGYLRVVGIAGKVSTVVDKISIWGKLDFEKIPIKLEAHQSKQDYDRKLEIQILPQMSALKVTFTDVPKEVLAGEVFPVFIELINSGPNEIGDIFIATNSPREFLIEPKTLIDMPLSIQKGLKTCSFILQ